MKGGKTMKELLNQISLHGMPVILLALINNLLTAIIKKPIKNNLKKKNSNYHKFSKYLTFLPVIIGALLSIAYLYVINNTFSFNLLFINTWIKNTSLSLALYAFEEKFVPNEEKIMSQKEIKENLEVLESIKELVNEKTDNETIILKGKK